MDYREKRKEESKRERKEYFPEEEVTKECPACKTSNDIVARFCQECGFKFPEDNIPIKEEPSPQIVQEKEEEVLVEKKKSFFSPAQIESIRKSEEKMKQKEETTAQAMKVAAVPKQDTVSEAVYVIDARNHRIQKFTPQGDFIIKWGREGSGDGEFIHPWGIAIDSENNVYITDADNHRIQKFTPQGDFITKWVGRGSGDGEFNYLYGIAISKK